MNAQLPPRVAENPQSPRLLAAGLKRIHQGKVRDTHELPGFPHLLFPYTTDRVSIFDFVLNARVTHKGAVLIAMTHFWLTGPLANIPHHMVAAGGQIDHYLPNGLWKNLDLQCDAMVIKRLQMLPVECVARGYLTGSGLKEYQKSGTVCGITLPPGLHDGSRLPEPIFTPTTKAEAGHDESITFEQLVELVGQDMAERLRDQTLEIYRLGAEYAATCGVLIADTKFEFGLEDGALVLADEVLTPDSSRFWDPDKWQEMQALPVPKAPPGWDKQPVREWGAGVATPFGVTGIGKLDPADPVHVEFVHSVKVPKIVTETTSRRYLTIFQKLARRHLVDHWGNQMGIRAATR